MSAALSHSEEVIDASLLLDQYKKAVDASTIVSKTNPKGIITYANDEFCRVSKYSRDELIGKAHNIVRHPDVPKEVFAQLWDTIQSGHMWKGLVPNRAKDGSTYIVDATIFPVTDANGTIIEYIAIRHNVTESLLEQYKSAVDASNIVSKTDPKGIITYANDEFCRVSKYSRDELIGKAHNIVRHPDVPKEVFAELWQTIQAGRIWKGIVPNHAKDGSTYIVDATIVPIKNANGEITEYIAIRHEITKLVETQKIADEKSDSLLEKIEQAVDIGLEGLVNHIPLPSVAVNGDDLVLAHNQLFDDIFDLGSDDLTIESLRQGKLILSTLFHDGEDGEAIRFDPVFDWKLLYDPDTARVLFMTGEGLRTFRLFMKPFDASEESRFIISFLEV